MPFLVPSLEQLKKLSRDTIVAAVARGRPVLRRTVEDAIGNAVGALLYLLLERLRVVWDQLWPDTATGRWLDRHAKKWGLTRKDRGPAAGKIKVTGVDASTLDANTTWESSAAVVYASQAEAAISGGEAFVLVRATSGGAHTNLPPGAELKLTSAIAGVDDVATVVVGDAGEEGLVNGVDLEADEQLRARVLARIQEPPAGGSIADYVRWAVEVAGVTRAWCVPNVNGPGTVLVLVVDDNADPIAPGQAKLDEVEAHLKSVAPATDVPGIKVAAPTLKVVDHELVLSPNTAQAQSAVRGALADFYKLRGIGATVRRSQIGGAIYGAPGEDWHELVAPAADVSVDKHEVAVLGEVTFQEPP